MKIKELMKIELIIILSQYQYMHSVQEKIVSFIAFWQFSVFFGEHHKFRKTFLKIFKNMPHEDVNKKKVPQEGKA